MANFFEDNKGLQFQLENPMMQEIIRLKERDYADYGKYDYAPKDFEDAKDSYKRVLSLIGEITAEVLANNAEDVDNQGVRIENNAIIYADGTKENHKALTDAGVYGLSLPR
ncbi:MAG: acyl-CoA dehydrogenase, partial [Bacteroidota bacterium]|nr:acyl-CoA dehydrogenase [Bacteroidota bacterium]